MISRDDFMFTVGYQDETAIIDGGLRSKYNKLSPIELAEQGIFKPAICAALYDKNDSDLEKILDIYNKKVQRNFLKNIEALKKTFGVNIVPEGIAKVEVI